jgi:lantibiotic leader peptide-processing serine protease
LRHFAVALCLIFVCSISLAAAPKQYVITGTGQGPGSTSFASSIPAAGGTVVRNMERIGIVLASSDDPNFAATMSAAGGVKLVTPDMEVNWINGEKSAEGTISMNPDGLNSEPFWAYQWNIRQIHADQAAANGDRGAGAVVAVLDAGCNYNHVDIAPNVITSLAVSFVPGEGVHPVHAGFNHGTHVSGIIAAAINNLGTQGVAPSAKIIPVKVLRESGSGSFGWLIAGLDYISNLNYSHVIRVDVANMSLGATFDRINQGGGGAGPLIGALNRAMNEASDAGILCISAAGNEAVDLDSRLWSIPAQSGNGIAVSATGPAGLTNFDRLASYSNYGRSVVTVAGPGGDAVVGATYPFDMVLAPGAGTGTSGYYFAAGTSMATPAVSGVAALIVGKYGHMSAGDLKSRVVASGVQIGAVQYFGRGRVDALAATTAP